MYKKQVVEIIPRLYSGTGSFTVSLKNNLSVGVPGKVSLRPERGGLAVITKATDSNGNVIFDHLRVGYRFRAEAVDISETFDPVTKIMVAT